MINIMEKREKTYFIEENSHKSNKFHFANSQTTFSFPLIHQLFKKF